MSSTGSGSGSTWLSLIEDKGLEVRRQFGQGYKAPVTINNGRSFRSALEKFCERRGEHKAPKLETKLIPSFTAIRDLAKAVGHSIEDLQTLAPNDSPEGLIWWTSFALLEVSRPFPRHYVTKLSTVRVPSWSPACPSRGFDSYAQQESANACPTWEPIYSTVSEREASTEAIARYLQPFYRRQLVYNLSSGES